MDTDTALRQGMAAFYETLLQADLTAFLDLFVGGEALTVIENDAMRGWPAFQAFIEKLFRDTAEIRLGPESCAVNVLADGVAVTTGVFAGHVRPRQGGLVPIRTAYTFVWLKQGGRWRIQHIHESSLP
jgi:uncharacterized protein (TIGR02246 family)